MLPIFCACSDSSAMVLEVVSAAFDVSTAIVAPTRLEISLIEADNSSAAAATVWTLSLVAPVERRDCRLEFCRRAPKW